MSIPPAPEAPSDDPTTTSTSTDPATTTATTTTTTARSSGRVRTKSQRVLEHEDTKRLLASQEYASPSGSSARGTARLPSPKGGKGKVRKKKEEVYCVCKRDSDGPMIECSQCNDWLHFECVGLSDTEAEKIYEYVCPACVNNTGKVTTYSHEIETFLSPSPPPGIVPAKRKQPAKPRAPKKLLDSTSGTPSSSYSSDDDATHAQDDDDHDASPPPSSPPLKRPRGPSQTKRPSVTPATGRKPSLSTTPAQAAPTSAGLPPMRKYVRDKLQPMFQALLGETDDVKAEEFAREVEEAMYGHFKDVIGGKETAGTRYKTQFNLLSSSITRGLRPILAKSITLRRLSPSQIATLTSAELASESQLADIERAKQASLQQTVKARAVEEPGAIRLGRDGFEKVEDRREKEMQAIEEEERAEKRREEARALRGSVDDGVANGAGLADEGGVGGAGQLSDESKTRARASPSKQLRSASLDEQARSPSHARSVSQTHAHAQTQAVQSPLRQSFYQAGVNPPGLTSAWGGAGAEGADAMDGLFDSPADQDQMELDLSELVADDLGLGAEGDVDMDVEYDLDGGPSEMEIFEGRPVEWTGGLINPADPSPHVPPLTLRHISSSQPHNTIWPLLLPHRNIEITGRVPTKDALKFLGDTVLQSGKELVAVVFQLGDGATEEERERWEGMVEYHIARERHAIYLPYGNKPPQGAVKELYMIPLRPSDHAPEFTDSIDGFALPVRGRKEPVFLGFFVASKKSRGDGAHGRRSGHGQTPPQPKQKQPQQQPQTHGIPGFAPSPLTQPPASTLSPGNAPPPVLQADRLQALMASLNPTVLAGVSGLTPPGAGAGTVAGASPIPGTGAGGQAGGYTPSASSSNGGRTPLAPLPGFGAPLHSGPPGQPQGYQGYEAYGGGYAPQRSPQRPSHPPTRLPRLSQSIRRHTGPRSATMDPGRISPLHRMIPAVGHLYLYHRAGRLVATSLNL
ncbi:hypothetical protein IAT38_002110 [Cryptococcus sp. DSM 104549]